MMEEPVCHTSEGVPSDFLSHRQIVLVYTYMVVPLSWSKKYNENLNHDDKYHLPKIILEEYFG